MALGPTPSSSPLVLFGKRRVVAATERVWCWISGQLSPRAAVRVGRSLLVLALALALALGAPPPPLPLIITLFETRLMLEFQAN